MATIPLTRKSRNGKAVRGVLQLGEREIKTLENEDYIIPEGTYQVMITYSQRFRKKMPLIANVPGRAGIRIHGGTRPEHSKGCLLISSPRDREQITEFINQKTSQNEKVYLTISSDTLRSA